MPDDYVLITRSDDGVAELQLNRAPMNPLSQAMLGAIRDAARALSGDADVNAVVVTGSERAFAAGADIDVWRTRDGGGILAVGRGICRRWEVGFEIAPDARGRGLGRQVVAAARGLVPDGVPLWAQVAPGNAASLRAVLGGGFAPVAAEVLFPRSS